MKVKEQVLNILLSGRGQSFSGEELAAGIGCTRAAVWKAVKSLKAEGCCIEGVNNKGYTLRSMSDVLSQSCIESLLAERGISARVICMDSVDSTSNVVKRLAAEGEKNDLVVIASEQTAGRGRRGRSFYSPKNTGLYLSFLLHPDIPVTQAPNLTTMAVTAEAVALERITGRQLLIKWVNDLVLDGKKVSGILTESSISMEDGSLEYVVIGVGINLYMPEGGFPEDIRDIAGSVYGDSEPRENLRNRVASELISVLLDYYKDFGAKSHVAEYEKRCFVIGREVTILTPDHNRVSDSGGRDRSAATVLGIDPDCHLHVRYKDGTEEYLSGGEISIRTE